MSTVTDYLDGHFDPVTTVFAPKLAQKIVSLTSDKKATAGDLRQQIMQNDLSIITETAPPKMNAELPPHFR